MKTSHLLASTLLAFTLAGCTGDIVGGEPRSTLYPTTRVPADEGAIAVDVEPAILRLTFAGEPPPFHAGEIVFGTEGPGYLRRVTAVERDGASVVLHTEHADLGDAFEMIALDEQVAVTPAGGLALPTSRRVEVVAGGQTWTAEIEHAPVQAHDRAITRSFVWEFPDLSITLFDPQGVVALTLEADLLRIEKTLTLDVVVDYAWFQLDELKVVTEDDTRATLDGLSVTVTGELPVVDVGIPIVDAPAIAIVPVGPLVFTVGTSVELGTTVVLSASAQVEASSDVGFHTWRRQGFLWDGELHAIDERTIDVDSDLGTITSTVSPLGVDAAVWIEGTLRLALYGVIGPELWARITPLAASMEFDADSVDGILFARADAGIRVYMPFFPIPGTSLTFAEWEHTYDTFHVDY